jgi:hypothetical protein
MLPPEDGWSGRRRLSRDQSMTSGSVIAFLSARPRLVVRIDDRI